MFTAINRFIARLDGDAPPHAREAPRPYAFGFQVLRNTDLQLAIEPWYDFIVGINGRIIDSPDPRLFAQEVRNCAGGTVTFELWSAKGQRARTAHVPVPASNDNAGGADTPGLGLTLQWTPLAAAASNVWHVLDVPAGSPADAAGLLPYGDYVLGATPEAGALRGEAGLGELVEEHIGRPLRLWVYNSEYDVTREVAITPSRDWGGEGALGCVLGYGALHRLPAPLSEPVPEPGETFFDSSGHHAAVGGTEEFSEKAAPVGSGLFFEPAETASRPASAVQASLPPPQTSGDFLVPAQMIAPPPTATTTATTSTTSTAAPSRSKKKHGHGGGASSRLMDDYLKEEEQKSRELDNAPSTGRRTPVAPPPKLGGAGGPPRAGGGPPPPPRADTPKAGGDTAVE